MLIDSICKTIVVKCVLIHAESWIPIRCKKDVKLRFKMCAGGV